jgi:hypothetical protein
LEELVVVALAGVREGGEGGEGGEGETKKKGKKRRQKVGTHRGENSNFKF